MKQNFTIIVEGIADQHFIDCYLQYLSRQDARIVYTKDVISHILPMDGWEKLKADDGQSQRNAMLDCTARGGTNLIIFDADNDAANRRKELQDILNNFGLKAEIFLFPNDRDRGALEDLLEGLINPANQCIFDCWGRYEKDLQKQYIEWKNPHQPTIPAKKTKIYGYLEALLGESNSQKKLIKEANRKYLNTDHWRLDNPAITELSNFLLTHLE